MRRAPISCARLCTSGTDHPADIAAIAQGYMATLPE
jgi:hypothetical protein